LAGDHGSLYVSDGAVLFRVDPRTGRVLARRTDLGARLSQAVISGGALWTDPRIGPCEWSAVVHALDLYTLAPIAIVAINIRGLAKPGASLWRTYRRGSIPKLDPSAPPYSAIPSASASSQAHRPEHRSRLVGPSWGEVSTVWRSRSSPAASLRWIVQHSAEVDAEAELPTEPDGLADAFVRFVHRIADVVLALVEAVSEPAHGAVDVD
jgi:hypothetical protein